MVLRLLLTSPGSLLCEIDLPEFSRRIDEIERQIEAKKPFCFNVVEFVQAHLSSY